jgi:hypothetical protein
VALTDGVLATQQPWNLPCLITSSYRRTSKHHLTLSSPDIKHVSNLEVISNTQPNTQGNVRVLIFCISKFHLQLNLLYLPHKSSIKESSNYQDMTSCYEDNRSYTNKNTAL